MGLITEPLIAAIHPRDMASHILSYSRIETIWWAGRSFVTQYLLPAMLLAWVGKRYLSGVLCSQAMPATRSGVSSTR